MIDEDFSFLPHLSPLVSPLFLLRYRKLSIIVPVISNGEQLCAGDYSETLTLIYVVCVTRESIVLLGCRVQVCGTHSWSWTTVGGILTHPLALLPLQLAEEDLQLFYSDAVAGQHTQHVHQQVWKIRVKIETCQNRSGGKKLANYYNPY